MTIWAFLSALATSATYATTLLAAGCVLFPALYRPVDDKIISETRRIGLMAAGAGILATGLAVLVQAANLGGGLASAFDGQMISIALEGPLGDAGLLRIVGLLLVIACLLVPALGIVGAAIAAVVSCASFAMIGHSLAEPRWLLAVALVGHLVGLSYWFGALLPLYRVAGQGSLEDAAALAHRFGNHAVIVVPILALCGAVFFIARTAELEDPSRGEGYALMLLAKFLLVCVLMALATFNRMDYVPMMQKGDEQGAIKLRNSIRIEAWTFASIFIATGILTRVTPLPS